jgi:hypothetical protein
MAILVYHGSDHKFDEFSFEKVGTESGTTGGGFGLYFTISKADALAYGDFVYTCLLELQNNLSNNKVTLQHHILRAIIDDIEKIGGISYFENFDENLSEAEKYSIINGLLTSNDTDTDIIGDLIISCFGGLCDTMLGILSKFGFTHTTDNITPDDPTIIHYIVYNLDSITIQKVQTLDEM